MHTLLYAVLNNSHGFWQHADDAAEDEQAAKAPTSPAKSEPKVASFSWASKLSAASSTGSSGAQPNLLQSLTGSLSGMGSFNGLARS